MNTHKSKILTGVLEVVNEVKQTAFCTDSVDLDYYLGGDLGIDSREMLEIWFDIENHFAITVNDHEKRNLYTLEDVVDVVTDQLEATAVAAAG